MVRDYLLFLSIAAKSRRLPLPSSFLSSKSWNLRMSGVSEKRPWIRTLCQSKISMETY